MATTSNSRVRLWLALWLVTAGTEAWTEFEGKEYRFLQPTSGDSDMRTWHEGRTRCMAYGGDLVTLDSPPVTAFVMEEINSIAANVEYWIGYNKIMSDSFKWSDGTTEYEPDWAIDEPDTSDPDKECTSIRKGSDGKWHSSKCSYNQGAICRREKGTGPRTDPPTQLVPGYCPNHFFAVGNKCYRLYMPADLRGGWTWFEAREMCDQEEGFMPSLGTIHSELEQLAVMSRVTLRGAHVWLGLRKDTEGEAVRWINNAPFTFQNWHPSSPGSSDQDVCGYMSYTKGLSRWHFEDTCESRKAVLCQTMKDPDVIISTPPPATPVSCPAGYLPHGQTCYLFVDTPATWQDAVAECSGHGATLLTIQAIPEDALVRAYLLSQDNEAPLWIGLEDLDADGEYRWVDGGAMVYANWAMDEPKEEDGSCVIMDMEGWWYGESCSKTFVYACKYTTVPPVTPPTHVEGSCPDILNERWEEIGGHCYLYRSTPKDYLGAVEDCLSHGALLITIHHPQVNMYLLEQANGYIAGVWIGFHKNKQTGSFEWIDGSEIQFTHWHAGYPSQEQGDCTFMQTYSTVTGEAFWENDLCTSLRHYACVIEKGPVVTTPPLTEGECPDEEWEHWGDSCFLFQHRRGYTGTEARRTCEVRGGDFNATLASIHSLQMNRHIQGRMAELSELPMTLTYWIGMERLVPEEKMEWGWMDGSEVAFPNWDLPGEPKHLAGVCASMNSDTGKWLTEDCEHFRGFVCRAKKPYVPVELPEEPANGPGLSGGQIAGVVIGALAVLAVFALVNVAIIIYHRRQNAARLGLQRTLSNASALSSSSSSSTRQLAKTMA